MESTHAIVVWLGMNEASFVPATIFRKKSRDSVKKPFWVQPAITAFHDGTSLTGISSNRQTASPMLPTRM